MKFQRLFILFLIAALLAGSLSGLVVMPVQAADALLYVKATATGANTGANWTDAYTKLQSALDVASTNISTKYEIWVAEGVYYPDEGGSHMDDNLNESFRLEYDNVQLYGGFAGSENARDYRNPSVHPTILSGDIDQDGTLTGNATHVVSMNSFATKFTITAATVLDGFTITAGNAGSGDGGGLYCYALMLLDPDSCMPTLNNLIFSGNTATRGGGMFHFSSGVPVSNPTLTNVTFSGNSATEGGGMYNISQGSGSASNPTLTNVVFSGNVATNQGGGMVNAGTLGGVTSPFLANVTFSGNFATNSGGGMYNTTTGTGTSHPTVVNSILWGNTAASGPQISNANPSAATTIGYSDIEGGCAAIANASCDNTLNQNPQFVAPSAASATPTTAGDYRLRLTPTSAVIDAGLDFVVTAGVDRDGNPRQIDIPNLGTALVDLGAYETRARLYVDKDATGASPDGLSWATAYPTLQSALDLTNATPGSAYEVWVAEGIYYPDEGGSHVNNSRSESFRLSYDNAQLYGGFSGSETLRTERLPSVYPTILSGEIDQIAGNAGNAYHVVYLDGTSNQAITASTILDGFTITAGNANDFMPPNSTGGGLYCQSSGSGRGCSPLLSNLVFTANQATSGAGMFSYADSAAMSSPILSNILFSGNLAVDGGGMYSNATGAGSVSSPALSNVTFGGNRATNSGGAMVNVVTGGTNSPTLVNSILWGNTAPYGAQMLNTGSSVSISYTDIEGGCPMLWTTCSAGMLNQDPQFITPLAAASAPTPDGNYRLSFGSLAIETGTNTACPATDLDGLPRPNDANADGTATCNLGAYESGEMICAAPYGFGHQSGVTVAITTPGNLACLYVDEIEIDHPNASGTTRGTGQKTGRYWAIRGLQSDKTSPASGFTLSLTLPARFTPDTNDKVCRYTGTATLWNCGASSFDGPGQTVTRAGIGVFSDWAIGNDSPTALEMISLEASSQPFDASLPWLLGLIVGTIYLYAKKIR
jgi:hypothetical protein